jgi:competence protein ComEC
VGQGDSILLDFPDGSVMLVDAGVARPDVGRAAILPLLEARRRARIDVLALTHPHPDHYGGLASVLEGIEVGELWDSGQAESESPDGPASQLLATARARGVRVRSPAELCGHGRRFGGARVDVLWPCAAYDPGYDPNDNSLVLRVTYGERALLLVGDLERHGEAMLLARRAPLRADFLKVGHHGSRTSSTAAFLAAVRPRFAAISAGRYNHYGHPHRETLEALAAVGAEVLRTDLHGGVVVTTDGHRLEVEAAAAPLRTAERSPASPRRAR